MMAVVSVVALLGCPSDDDASGETEDSAGTETSSTTDSTSATASASSTSAGTDSASGTSASTTDSTTDDSGTTAGPGTDGSSSGGTGTDGATTGGAADPCADLGREECVGDRGCEPIVCRPFEMMGDGFCVGAEAFIGCRSAELNCAEVRTTTCEMMDATVYVCGNSCIPDAWMECAAPVDGQVNMCPGNGGG